MEILDLILPFLGAGMLVTKSLIWIPAVILEMSENPEFIQSEIEKQLNENPEIKDKAGVRKFLTFVLEDNFSKDPLFIKFRRSNEDYLRSVLLKLKYDIIKFYLSSLTQTEELNLQTKLVCDVHTTINSMILQISRLRMVIEPEIQISRNIHPQSEIHYLAAKSFWIDDNGEKKREFTRSLGPLEDYGYSPKDYKKEIVSKDPKVIEESLKRIQEVIYVRYKEYYGE